MKIILRILFLLATLFMYGAILYIGGIIIIIAATQHGPIQYMFTGALWVTIPIMIGISYLIWIIIKELFKGPE